jgi:hypothetical protein
MVTRGFDWWMAWAWRPSSVTIVGRNEGPARAGTCGSPNVVWGRCRVNEKDPEPMAPIRVPLNPLTMRDDASGCADVSWWSWTDAHHDRERMGRRGPLILLSRGCSYHSSDPASGGPMSRLLSNPDDRHRLRRFVATNERWCGHGSPPALHAETAVGLRGLQGLDVLAMAIGECFVSQWPQALRRLQPRQIRRQTLAMYPLWHL